jgi:CRISPR-associated endoribonuclease Cas6
MTNHLYSIILEMCATEDAILDITTGHQAHALLLDLIQQINPDLSTRLHNEGNYRPFTVSPLRGTLEKDQKLYLRTGHTYSLRVTLLDGRALWNCLSQNFLVSPNILLRLGKITFVLARVISTPATDPTGWAGYSDWQTLANAKPRHFITMRFASPTAFSLGNRQFALFPEPALLWDSLLRTWNNYTPEILQLDKASIREAITQHVTVSDYALQTTTLHFPKYIQKGFRGTCTYQIKGENDYATQITALADFARYAGIGYKTTMGMGQAHVEDTP